MIMFSVTLFALTGMCLTQELATLSPQRAEVLEGGRVLLTCFRESNMGHFHWTFSSSNQHLFEIHFDSDEGDVCRLDFVHGFENNSYYSMYCNVSSISILLRHITRSRHGERWDCESYGRSNSAIVYVIEKMSVSEGQLKLLDAYKVQITNNTEDLFSTKSEILLHVNRSFDGRRIYCSTTNHPGKTVSSAKIFVYVQDIVSLFVNGFEGEDIITVRENDTVQLTCLIGTVAPNAKLTFRWQTVLVEEFDTNNLTYTLHRVSCSDAGDYTCVETNALNSGKLSIGHLTLLVKCPPHVHPNTPIQGNVQAKRGDIVTFSLNIIAYPDPQLSDIVWMKLTNANWTTVDDNLHTEISIRGLQTNLTIKSVTEEDYGKYRLTVVNELGAYSQNFTLGNAEGEEKSDTNVIAIVIGSVVGIVVLLGIISAAIFLRRNANHERDIICISMMMKWKGGKKKSTIWKTSSSAAAESDENPNSSKPPNIYEKIRRNGEVEKEYQEIRFGEDDKCVYKNMQLRPPPATS